MTNHSPSSSYDVLVVGAGPSGLTTAIAMARSGVRTLLIEKHPGLSVFPKATGLRPRTMEILRSWGLEQTVLSQSQPTRLSMAIKPMLSVPGSEVSLGLPEPEDCGSSARRRSRSARRTGSRRSCSITSSSAAVKSGSPPH